MAEKHNTFGEFLKEKRASHKPPLTQRDVAQALNDRGFYRAASSVAHWENKGYHTKPDALTNPEFVVALASILDTTPTELLQAAGFLDSVLDLPSLPQQDILHVFEKFSDEETVRVINMIKAAFPDKFR